MSRELMKKELDDAELTASWALANLKKLAEKIDDPKFASEAKEINLAILNWWCVGQGPLPNKHNNLYRGLKDSYKTFSVD